MFGKLNKEILRALDCSHKFLEYLINENKMLHEKMEETNKTHNIEAVRKRFHEDIYMDIVSAKERQRCFEDLGIDLHEDLGVITRGLCDFYADRVTIGPLTKTFYLDKMAVDRTENPGMTRLKEIEKNIKCWREEIRTLERIKQNNTKRNVEARYTGEIFDDKKLEDVLDKL